jgi:hypothetical protein
MPPFDAQQFIEAVSRCTARLRQLDARRAVFGSSKHGYTFAAPLPEATVAAYEHQHAVRLPLEYRAFITGVGNGGAGPDYGVLPLPLQPPDLQQDWPYNDAYDAADDEEFEPDLPGAIQIADCGCETYQLLVVSGVHAGEVWLDARHHYPGGFRPLTARDGTRLRFDHWWLLYMNHSLERFEHVRSLMNARRPHEEIHRILDGSIMQLEVDDTMASLLNVALRGTPKVIPDKPWGLTCGQVDEHYSRWLERGDRIE